MYRCHQVQVLLICHASYSSKRLPAAGPEGFPD
jgi:hypothetical protein